MHRTSLILVGLLLGTALMPPTVADHEPEHCWKHARWPSKSAECGFSCNKNDFLSVYVRSGDDDPASVMGRAQCGGAEAYCDTVWETEAQTKRTCKASSARNRDKRVTSASSGGGCMGAVEETWPSGLTIDCWSDPSPCIEDVASLHFCGGAATSRTTSGAGNGLMDRGRRSAHIVFANGTAEGRVCNVEIDTCVTVEPACYRIAGLLACYL